MTRTSSRLSAVLVLVALFGLSLPVSALDGPRRVQGVLSWLQEWVDAAWSLFVPESQQPTLAVEQESSPADYERGILIDPNGGPGR